MNEKAFEALGMLEGTEQAVPSTAMAETLGVDPSEVAALIEDLSSLGYDIESSAEGHRLIGRSDLLLPYELKRQLRTRFIGHQAVYRDNTPSTLSIAKDMAEKGDPQELHGLVVLAEEQTGGQGRMGREWFSPRGGIWATVLLKPKIPVDRLFMVTMAGSVAIARAIRREYDIGALIKWPNDIFIGSKKVAGLLQEISVDDDEVNYVLLGMGIDANIDIADLPEEVRDIAVSLKDEMGETIDRNRLLARVLKELELRILQLESGEYDTILREWKSICLSLNRRVQVKTLLKTVRGEAVGIDRHGALLVRKDNGVIEKVFAGDIF
ncbi:MAG: biotin--[acetyl-CoA-carboxylase] ligase [Candidatus Methanomethylophilaceae archaeon]|nr:biotin--[acetyl-CoA-carboxylase] ligase [Candidatus Methanomethylophilaceae archaeon]